MARELKQPVNFMEVCGTHTMSIYQYGIRSLLPPQVRLISGPGCPVCVTPVGYVDHSIAYARLPETVVEYKDLTFGGDMRDITVSFAKIKRELGFETTLNVDDGIRELLFALKSGLIRNPTDERYRNAQFIVQ